MSERGRGERLTAGRAVLRRAGRSRMWGESAGMSKRSKRQVRLGPKLLHTTLHLPVTSKMSAADEE